jgi:hypothetical protein
VDSRRGYPPTSVARKPGDLKRQLSVPGQWRNSSSCTHSSIMQQPRRLKNQVSWSALDQYPPATIAEIARVDVITGVVGSACACLAARFWRNLTFLSHSCKYTSVDQRVWRVLTTDWAQIAALYGVLLRLDDNPVVALNHAVAISMVAGLRAGLTLLQPSSFSVVVRGRSDRPALGPLVSCADRFARRRAAPRPPPAFRREVEGRP